MLRWAPLAVAGGAAGAALLLVTPESVFDRVVPFLLAAAAIILLVQPQISAWLAGRHSQSGRFLLPGGLIAAAAYDGYWGAGAGVMILALLMITTGQPLPGPTPLKNMLLGIADVTCCALFIAFWPIDWAAAAPLAGGFLIGSVIGPTLGQTDARASPPGRRRPHRAGPGWLSVGRAAALSSGLVSPLTFHGTTPAPSGAGGSAIMRSSAPVSIASFSRACICFQFQAPSS